MIYKVIINTLLPEEDIKDSIMYRGQKLERGHAIFLETNTDLTKENSPTSDVIITERVDPLPEVDLFGDKIVVHKI